MHNVWQAFTAAGAICWRDVTKPHSWAAYGSLPGKVSVIIPVSHHHLPLIQPLDNSASQHCNNPSRELILHTILQETDSTRADSWCSVQACINLFGSALQALNEEKGIAQTLRAVLSLDPPPHEVIVVDGGSTDR